MNAPWSHSPAPKMPGIHVLKAYPLAELVPFIDWTYFFLAWKLKGIYPKILEGDSPVAEEARKLFADGKAMLQKIVSGNLLEARAVFGVFPVERHGDSAEVFNIPCDCGCVPAVKRIAMFHFLRQQEPSEKESPLRSLADFLSPKERDWMGLFALSAGFGAKNLQIKYKTAGDPYSELLVQSLAARLTEAFAEKLHREVGTKYWGYVPATSAFFGIRPAPGYPSCPDHSEKATLWKLLNVTERTGMRLTETYMMDPDCSICGYYFAHPKSRYFGIGSVGEDQLADYARRKDVSVDEARRWIARGE